MSHDATAPFNEPEWLSFLAPPERQALGEVTRLTQSAGLPTLIGGALGLAAYTPLRRYTKDIDLYILPDDLPAVEATLRGAGFKDLFEKEPYDRGWISRSYRGEVIIDIIWSFANYLARVDEAWFTYGPFISSGSTEGLTLQIVPPEELLWAKLFVFQRGRCDWPDLLNLLYYTHDTLDRERLLARLGPHAPLFHALEEILHWIAPSPPDFDPERVALFDSRDWFLPAFTPRPPTTSPPLA